MFLQETLNNQGSHDAWDSLNQTRYHRFPYINILATVFGRSKKEALLPPHVCALHVTDPMHGCCFYVFRNHLSDLL